MEFIIYPDILNERCFYWNSILKTLKSKILSKFSYQKIPTFDSNVLLIGYYQSSKYFKYISNTIKHLLSFPCNLMSDIIGKYGDIFSSNHVIVHARKCDYLKLYNKISYHGPLSISYYENAKNENGENSRNPKIHIN